MSNKTKKISKRQISKSEKFGQDLLENLNQNFINNQEFSFGERSIILEKSIKKLLEIDETGTIHNEIDKMILFLYQSVYVNNLILDFKISSKVQEKLTSLARIIQYFIDFKSRWPATISSAENAVKFAKSYCAVDRETFVAIYLDIHHKVLSINVISYGTVDYAYVNIRTIFSYALKYDASKIIIIHNHPSGDPTPSSEDIAFTDKINLQAKEFGLILLDHIIIANTYFSFKSEGLL